MAKTDLARTALRTIEEAASYLGCSVRTIHRLRAAEEIEAVMIGKRGVRITQDSLERYIDELNTPRPYPKK